MALKNCKPHVVSKDLRGYSVMFYGAPKSGKTTIASQFPRAVLAAFEKGYSALPGVYAEPLNTWSEFRTMLRELNDPEIKEKFETVVIDTVDIAWTCCEKYICNQASDNVKTYTNIKDIPYGAGFSQTENEFDAALRSIIQMGYGLVLISHSREKTIKDAYGNEYSQTMPTLSNGGRKVCARACDIIGYSESHFTADGQLATSLYMRGTPRFIAGSRFKYTPEVIPFNYESLVQSIADAVTKLGEENTTVERATVHLAKVYDFDQLKVEFGDLSNRLMTEAEDKVAAAAKITSAVETYLGVGRKVSDIAAVHAEELHNIIEMLKA